MSADPIDFVVTWVDGNDPVWQEAKSHYTTADADTRPARYRDWEQLKYWFRAVEKYAPWVNKVHFVTFGHLPKWLNTANPKLHIVKHEDFISKEYLPVFNSTAIEIYLHRIPGLSENFVYFNDDFYLMKPSRPEDFFKHGKPVDMPVLSPVQAGVVGEPYYYHLYNDYSIYVHYFEKKKFLKHLSMYVNFKYGKVAFTNLLNVACKNLHFDSFHFPKSFQKASFEIIWRDYEDILQKTAESRFRTNFNNSPELFRGYQLITGNFYPERKAGVYVNTEDVDAAQKAIISANELFLCLGDNVSSDTFESARAEINTSFDIVFPEKSSFELGDGGAEKK